MSRKKPNLKLQGKVAKTKIPHVNKAKSNEINLTSDDEEEMKKHSTTQSKKVKAARNIQPAEENKKVDKHQEKKVILAENVVKNEIKEQHDDEETVDDEIESEIQEEEKDQNEADNDGEYDEEQSQRTMEAETNAESKEKDEEQEEIDEEESEEDVDESENSEEISSDESELNTNVNQNNTKIVKPAQSLQPRPSRQIVRANVKRKKPLLLMAPPKENVAETNLVKRGQRRPIEHDEITYYSKNSKGDTFIYRNVDSQREGIPRNDPKQIDNSISDPRGWSQSNVIIKQFVDSRPLHKGYAHTRMWRVVKQLFSSSKSKYEAINKMTWTEILQYVVYGPQYYYQHYRSIAYILSWLIMFIIAAWFMNILIIKIQWAFITHSCGRHLLPHQCVLKTNNGCTFFCTNDRVYSNVILESKSDPYKKTMDICGRKNCAVELYRKVVFSYVDSFNNLQSNTVFTTEDNAVCYQVHSICEEMSLLDNSTIYAKYGCLSEQQNPPGWIDWAWSFV